jgi:hypothetical protein
MSDTFEGMSSGLDSPASKAVAVVEDVALTNTSRALYVGVAGDLVVTMAGGGDATFKNVAAGSFLPIRVTMVKAATTATDILALI